MQGLHHHMPRIVENQQRLGRIVWQLAGYHHGLEPEMNVFLQDGHWQVFPGASVGTAPVAQTGAVWTKVYQSRGRIYRGTGSGTAPSRLKNQVRNSCPEVHCPEVHAVGVLAAYLMPAPRQKGLLLRRR